MMIEGFGGNELRVWSKEINKGSLEALETERPSNSILILVPTGYNYTRGLGFVCLFIFIFLKYIFLLYKGKI